MEFRFDSFFQSASHRDSASCDEQDRPTPAARTKRLVATPPPPSSRQRPGLTGGTRQSATGGNRTRRAARARRRRSALSCRRLRGGAHLSRAPSHPNGSRGPVVCLLVWWLLSVWCLLLVWWLLGCVLSGCVLRAVCSHHAARPSAARSRVCWGNDERNKVMRQKVSPPLLITPSVRSRSDSSDWISAAAKPTSLYSWKTQGLMSAPRPTISAATAPPPAAARSRAS